jgi:5-methylcytosine-specific restriction endonuclease McrA
MKTKKFNYKSYIRSALRRIWLWHPERAQTIRNARVAPGKVACRQCGIRMVETPPKGVKKEYEVDHIVPASEPASQIVSWDDYIKRLLEVTVKDLRVLCKGCHGKKTKTENENRQQSKRTLGRVSPSKEGNKTGYKKRRSTRRSR